MTLGMMKGGRIPEQQEMVGYSRGTMASNSELVSPSRVEGCTVVL